MSPRAWRSSHVPQHNRSEQIGLYYLLLRTPADLEHVAPDLEGPFGSDASAQREALAQLLAKGQAVLLFSNGSRGMGDIYDLVQRVTHRQNQVIIATHLGDILADPPNSPPAIGDRFEIRIEAMEVPATVERLRFETLPYDPAENHSGGECCRGASGPYRSALVRNHGCALAHTLGESPPARPRPCRAHLIEQTIRCAGCGYPFSKSLRQKKYRSRTIPVNAIKARALPPLMPEP